MLEFLKLKKIKKIVKIIRIESSEQGAKKTNNKLSIKLGMPQTS